MSLFHIREIPIRGEAILAPMDGFSDYPFRSICRQLGSAMSYTEFISAKDVLTRLRRVKAKLTFSEAERPMVFQLYGESAAELLEAALYVQDLQPDIIDINMGCPAKTVANRGCGVGLMRTPQSVAQIFSTLTTRLRIPVTGKMRLGWEGHRNYLEIAKIAEENGAALLAVHGRTKNQGYGGQADWDAIAEVKAAARIPILGNGDVRRVEDIARMKSHTGCDAVMIGRGAIANPWIFSGMDRENVPPAMVRQTVQEHWQRTLAFYGAEDGERLFRKYAVQYLLLQKLDRETRKNILRKQPTGDWLLLLDEAYAALQA